jgi:hypothetical protein
MACVAQAQITLSPGYDSSFTNPAGGMGLAFVPGGFGDWLTMEGSDVAKRSSAGGDLGTVYTGLDPLAFGSFVTAQAGGVLAAAGQTGSGPDFPGDVHVFRLDGTDAGSFGLAGNYDAAFDPVSGMLFVSGLNGLSENALWAVDPDLDSPGFGGAIQVGAIGGNSGPLAFDPQGNLFVGTSAVDLDGNGVGDFDSGIVAFNAAEVADVLANPGTSLLSDGLWDVILADAPFQNVADLTTDSEGDLIYHDYTNVLQFQIEVAGSGPAATIAVDSLDSVCMGPAYGLNAIDFLADPSGLFEPGPGQGLGGTLGVRFDSNGDWVTDSMVGVTPVPEPAALLAFLAGVGFVARRRSL